MGHVSTKTGLRPVEIKNGFINRESLFKFFSQLPGLERKLQIEKASSGLLKRLVHLSFERHPQHIHLRIVCGRCRNTLDAIKCVYGNEGHQAYNYRWEYLVDIESLRGHIDDILAVEWPKDAEKFRRNFRLLIDHL